MKRFLLALALTVTALLLSAPAAHASVDNFLISTFKADYELAQLEDGRSQLTVTETIVADFPNFNQNKGIVRAIPERYDTFSLEFELLEVTRNGEPEIIYDRTIEDGYHIIALGTDDFLQGRQTYQIRYQLENVITEQNGTQEFFWNVNGTQWRQQMLDVEATIRIDPALQTTFTDAICFQGGRGSRESCDVTFDGITAQAEASRVLGVAENMSFALKLSANSFTLPAKTLGHFVPYGLLAFAILFLILNSYLLIRYGRDHPGRGLTPTQYLPPKDIPLLTAAKVKGVFAKVVPAQLVDLAVRGAVELIDHESEGKKGEFTVRYVRNAHLHEKEVSFLTKLFSQQPAQGSSFRFTKKHDATQQAVAKAMIPFVTQMAKPTTDKKYRQQPKQLTWGVFSLFAAFGGFFILMPFYDLAPTISGVAIVVTIVSSILAIIAVSRHPLTEEGRALKDYLVGLERYIKLAEKDRLAFLQSVEGAERKEAVVRLYESVLPYAILFGHEKSWVKVLQLHYQEDALDPAWIRGASLATMSRSLSGFSASSSTYGFTASSGGGGGGFSGGSSGGGGGGGGGGGR